MIKSNRKLFYKGIAFILTFSLLLPLVSFNFSANALTGSGTISSPYKIGTEAELKEFADIVLTNREAYGTLTADITVTEQWTPIGGSDGAVTYSGVFNGGKHKITFSAGIADGDFVGLFAVNEGAIQNLTIEGGDISSQNDLAFAGGFAGLNRGTITNCTNNLNITASGKNAYAGGIAGTMQFGTISGCVNNGTITITSNIESENITDKEASAGGIVAFNYNGFIKKCTNNGAISNSEEQGYTGGIAGNNSGSIDNCLNTGEIITSDSKASSLTGGIAGLLYHNTNIGTDATVKNSLNLSSTGEVLGTNAAGENAGILSNCYYKTEISGSEDNGAVSVTLDELNSGSVTYRLNGSTAANPAWGQNLADSDSLPVIGDVTVYPDKENEGNYTNTKPTDGNHNYTNGACPICGEVIGKVAGYNITLNGAIGLNYYFDVKDTVAIEDIKLTFNDKSYELKDVTNDNSLSAGLAEGYKRYMSTVTVNADQMNMSIVAKLTFPYESQNITVVGASYSLNKYLNSLYTSPGTKNVAEVKAIAQAMSTYGYYSNEYFKKYPHYEAFITLNTLTLKSTDIDAKYDTYYAPNTEGITYGIKHYANSLQHLDEIHAIYYAQGNVTKDTVMRYKAIDITTGEYKDEDWIIKPVTMGAPGYNWAITDKIPISELGTTRFEFSFGTVNESGEYAVDSLTKYATPYGYLKLTLKGYENNGTDPNSAAYKIIQAIYNYSEAAKAYFDSKHSS